MEIGTGKGDLKKIRKLVIIYFISNIINGYASQMTDIGYGVFMLYPLWIIAFVKNILSFCRIKKKLKQRADNDNAPMSIKRFITSIIIPIVVLVVPFVYELYILNSCEYMLTYNYSVGWINSEDTYIAIINNELVTVTLETNIFDRKGVATDELCYNIIYTDDIEISKVASGGNKIVVQDEDIKKIAIDALEKCPSAKGASVDYFPEGKYAIISLTDEETHGTILGEYFYYDNKYVENISTHGSLEEIVYYK